MTTFIYNNSRWKVLQVEWPERTRFGRFELKEPQMEAEQQKAIESVLSFAIDVRDEDQLELSHLVWRETTDKETQWQWHPQENVPYRLEVEVEIHHPLDNSKPKARLVSQPMPGSIMEAINAGFKVPSGTLNKQKEAGRPEDFPWPAKDESGQHEETQRELWKEFLTKVFQISGENITNVVTEFQLRLIEITKDYTITRKQQKQ